MKRQLILAVIVGLVLASGAQAGITDWTCWWVDNSPLDMNNTGWYWNGGALYWDVWETYVASDVDESISRTEAFADEDPIIHVEKTITNGSTFVWTDYHVVISGSQGVSYVAGSATSDVFGTIVENGGIIDFFAPNSVPIGGTVTITFDILIPAGPFTFDISQTPTPEPASFALLGLGALLIRRRR